MAVEAHGDGQGSGGPRMDDERIRELEELAQQRFKVGGLLTVAMLVIYFAFILLIAFNKELMGEIVTEGLSLGMVLGVIVILSVWALTLIYVRWANTVYEPKVKRLKR
jgi:uncharacterized membrane protein (DUF485 family)